MTRSLRILFAGGGTGGHLIPAIRLADGCRDYAKEFEFPAPEIGFVGNAEGMEAEILLKKREKFFPVEVQGFHRGNLRTMFRKNLRFFGNLWKSYRDSREIMTRFNPDIVVGTGGYVSGPPLFAATRKKIPTLIQEQNSYPGITTRLLAARVDEIHVAYKEAATRLKKKIVKFREIR